VGIASWDPNGTKELFFYPSSAQAQGAAGVRKYLFNAHRCEPSLGCDFSFDNEHPHAQCAWFDFFFPFDSSIGLV
jgi:hypothetical protein